MSYEAWGEPPDACCAVCGNTCHDCVCPECHVCGESGNPDCYLRPWEIGLSHGLVRTGEQERAAARNAADDHGGPGDYSGEI